MEHDVDNLFVHVPVPPWRLLIVLCINVTYLHSSTLHFWKLAAYASLMLQGASDRLSRSGNRSQCDRAYQESGLVPRIRQRMQEGRSALIRLFYG